MISFSIAPPSLLSQDLDSASTLQDERWRTYAPTRLAPHLSPPLLTLALDAARSLPSEGSRAAALTGLAPHLSPQLRPPVRQLALDAARSIQDEERRATALTGLAPHLAQWTLAHSQPQVPSQVWSETLHPLRPSPSPPRERAGRRRHRPGYSRRVRLVALRWGEVLVGWGYERTLRAGPERGRGSWNAVTGREQRARTILAGSLARLARCNPDDSKAPTFG